MSKQLPVEWIDGLPKIFYHLENEIWEYTNKAKFIQDALLDLDDLIVNRRPAAKDKVVSLKSEYITFDFSDLNKFKKLNYFLENYWEPRLAGQIISFNSHSLAKQAVDYCNSLARIFECVEHFLILRQMTGKEKYFQSYFEVGHPAARKSTIDYIQPSPEESEALSQLWQWVKKVTYPVGLSKESLRAELLETVNKYLTDYLPRGKEIHDGNGWVVVTDEYQPAIPTAIIQQVQAPTDAPVCEENETVVVTGMPTEQGKRQSIAEFERIAERKLKDRPTKTNKGKRSALSHRIIARMVGCGTTTVPKLNAYHSYINDLANMGIHYSPKSSKVRTIPDSKKVLEMRPDSRFKSPVDEAIEHEQNNIDSADKPEWQKLIEEDKDNIDMPSPITKSKSSNRVK